MKQLEHPIIQEICKVAKINPNVDDNWEEVLSRLTHTAMELTDEDWLKLTNEAQKYINECVDALQDDKTLPLLELPKVGFSIPPPTINNQNSFGGINHSRKAKIPKNWIITVLSDENPKRKGKKSWGQFRLYRDGLTVKEYIKIGGSRAGVNYDVNKGFIKVDPPKG